MQALAEFLAVTLNVVRPLVFVAAVATGAAAVASWAVRTKRLPPFSPVAKFTRARVDPLWEPAEKRIVRAGGMPAHAPWWTLAAVVLGGLVLISALRFVVGQLLMAEYAMRGGVRGILQLGVTWTFAFFRIAIIARVLASWVGGSAYNKWWRWAFVSTEWFMGPLRRVIPTIGPIDISPIVAYFGLAILQSIVLSAI
jgi:YggT family protein